MKSKKLLFSILMMLSLVVMVELFTSKPLAYDGIDSTGTATWTISNEEISTNYGVYYSKATGKNTSKGATSLDRLTNYFEMKTDGINSKLATWTYIGNNYQPSVTPLAEIAKDYEKHHPGWIVVGGINADQWYYGTTQSDAKGGYFYYKNQSYYPLTIDGQNLFTVSPLGPSGNGIAITNNSENPIVKTSYSNVIELQIYDEFDQLIAKYPVSGYNQTPNANATTVWSGRLSENVLGDFISKQVDSTNDLYIIERAELAYMNNSREYPSAGVYNPMDSFYGRGTITTVTKTIELKKGQFAIETTNEELKNLLKEGVKVIVEQQYAQKEANEAESVTGYHTVHMENGVVNGKGSNDYNNSDRPRSIFGVKEDGSYFLLTIRNYPKTGGPDYAETNSILNYYGAYTAFQDDGGGSVTAIYRNEKGGFDNVSPSTDNRSIFSGLFFVVRDPLFNQNTSKTTAETITLDLKEQDFVKELTDIKVTLNDKEYQVKENQVVMRGLEEDTKYNLTVTYKTKDNTECTTSMYVTTKTYDPGIDINPTSKGFTIGLRQSDENLITSKITIDIEGKKYQIENKDGTKTEYIINDLFKGETYQLTIRYEVTIKETKETYTREIEKKEYQTLSYEVPELIEFKVQKRRGKIIITIEYEDKDNLITKISLIDNNKEISLEKGNQNYTIEDDTKDHIYQLEINYTLPNGNVRILKSEKEEITHEHEWEEATCQTPKTCKLCGTTEGEKLEHTESNWIIDENPTCEKEGKQHKVCTKCQEVLQEETIEKAEHEWEEATTETPKKCSVCGTTEGEKLPEPSKKKNCKKTSVALILTSISLLCTSVYLFRKKR